MTNSNYIISINRPYACDIESKELVFSDVGSHWGMQCNHLPDTMEYQAIKVLCEEVIERVKQIDELNKR